MRGFRRSNDPNSAKGGTTLSDVFLSDRLLKLPEVIDRLGVSSASVRRWTSRGLLPRIKRGRVVRYRESDVARLIANGLPPGPR